MGEIGKSANKERSPIKTSTSRSDLIPRDHGRRPEPERPGPVLRLCPVLRHVLRMLQPVQELYHVQADVRHPPALHPRHLVHHAGAGSAGLADKGEFPHLISYNELRPTTVQQLKPQARNGYKWQFNVRQRVRNLCNIYELC